MDRTGTVLVTGASGFVAEHCILELLRRGYAVRGTLRSMARADEIRTIVASNGGDAARLELVEADLTRDDGWVDACGGCRYALHVASPFPARMPRDPRELIEPALEGTLRVLRAAAAANVKRTVLTSSAAAICYGRGVDRDRPFDEQDWSDPTSADNSDYTRSKTLAERAAWDFVARDGRNMELVAINPVAILGPVLAKDYSTSAELVLKLMNHDFPACPRIGFAIVDVRDVAWLEVEAMERPLAAGQRYLAGGPFCWASDIAQVLQRHYPDRRIPTGTLPDWLVRLFALFDKTTASVTFELGKKRPVSWEKAKTELDWQPRSAEEAILACGKSLIDHGVVR